MPPVLRRILIITGPVDIGFPKPANGCSLCDPSHVHSLVGIGQVRDCFQKIGLHLVIEFHNIFHSRLLELTCEQYFVHQLGFSKGGYKNPVEMGAENFAFGYQSLFQCFVHFNVCHFFHGQVGPENTPERMYIDRFYPGVCIQKCEIIEGHARILSGAVVRSNIHQYEITPSIHFRRMEHFVNGGKRSNGMVTILVVDLFLKTVIGGHIQPLFRTSRN